MVPEDFDPRKPSMRPYLPRRRDAFLAAGLLCAVGTLQAEVAYPNRAVRLVVAGAAGSSFDVMARFLGQRLASALGQPFVVDNRPGAATIIAAKAVASAVPDGYTLLYTSGTTTSINPFVYHSLQYKPEDFTGVVNVVSVPYVLIVGGSSPYRNLQDLLTAAKERPGQLNYASYGIGTAADVVFARLVNATGISVKHIPYRDGGITDIS